MHLIRVRLTCWRRHSTTTCRESDTLEVPVPKTKHQVQSFLGLIGYYRAYVPNFASITTPLTDLTKKGALNTVVWRTEHDEAFKRLKQVLTEKPVLIMPDFTKTSSCKLMHQRQELEHLSCKNVMERSFLLLMQARSFYGEREHTQ